MAIRNVANTRVKGERVSPTLRLQKTLSQKKIVNFNVKKSWCVFRSQMGFKNYFSDFYLAEFTLTLQSESNVHGKHN